MENEILIVRQDEGYRVLHGHLQLAAFLSQVEELFVDVMGEGQAKVFRSGKQFLVLHDNVHFPLLRI